VVVKSSNIGTSRIALELTGDTLYQTLSQFGFGKASGIQFPGEAIGTLPYHSKWRGIQVATMSYGYGMSGTSVQLARAYAILANNSLSKPVSLLNGGHPDEPERVVPAQVAKQVRDMLAAAVDTGGTGTHASVPFFRVAGKTGTVHAIGVQGY